ncbi:MAG: DNA-binding protein WhiA [Oscillospiraceae bacterium]|nr:DNA-binding protein WhiA [Oscillospiraceae bacterium]
MSFSADVKSELTKLPVGKRCCAVAECYGIFLYASTFNHREIRVITESLAFGARLEELLQRGFGVQLDSRPAQGAQKGSYMIDDPKKLRRIADTVGYDLNTHLSHAINFSLLEEPCCTIRFLRGAFSAGGSVTAPEKGYHLEFVTRHKSVSGGLFSILRDMDFIPRDTVRRGKYVIYFKQSGAIEDMLTTMGATGSAMAYMTAKVERHMKNAIQRKVNCDTANVEKSVEAAQAQLTAIRRIEQGDGLESLPDKLQQTALLRIVNPEASLAELAELADPPVTKSCMSHRLRKLVELGSG